MPYVPEKGDFVIVTFDPQAGHEQRGRRPALVVGNTLFNKHTGLAIAGPVTNTLDISRAMLGLLSLEVSC